MDDETIDNIFQGVLEDLPRPTSKVHKENYPKFVFIEFRLHYVNNFFGFFVFLPMHTQIDADRMRRSFLGVKYRI